MTSWLGAAVAGVLAAGAGVLAAGAGSRPTASASPTARAQRPADADVQVQMRHVDYHVDSTVVLHIAFLRGALEPTRSGTPPYLDDKRSFKLAIDSGQMSIAPASLAALLNRYVFAYPDAPLRRLTVEIDRGQLREHGKLHGIGFTLTADVGLTPAGEIRLHPSSIKVAGLSVKGLMSLFGVQLQKLVDVRRAVGLRLEGNDFLLDATALLPPPTTRGRLTAITVADTEIVESFAPSDGRRPAPLTPPAHAENYIYFRGGKLRFGKLTMADADLEIMDADPRDAFDFFLDRYNAQLVAGFSRNTRVHGLLVSMPDFRRVSGSAAAHPKPPR